MGNDAAGFLFSSTTLGGAALADAATRLFAQAVLEASNFERAAIASGGAVLP